MESVDKSVRRKMARAVYKYLGLKPRPNSFSVVPRAAWDQEHASQMFGTPSGFMDMKKNIFVPDNEVMSALHELLHAAGFNEDNVSEFWNEGITQAVAEDIARLNGFVIPITYKKPVAYVRNKLLPLTGMTVRDFARRYAVQKNKALYLTRLVWNGHSDKFSDQSEWGTETASGMYDEFQHGMTDWNPYLDYLASL